MLALAAALLLAQTSQYPGSSWNNPSYTLQDSGIQVVLILPDGGPLAVNQGAAGNQPWLVEIAPDAGPVAVSGSLTTCGTATVSGTVTANAGTGPFNPGPPDGGNYRESISDGTLTCNAGTGNFTVVQPTGTNLHAVLDTTSTTACTQATAANLNATVVGTVTANLVGDGGNVRVSISDAPAVSGTVTATLVGDGGNVRVSISDAPAVTGTVSCNLLADGGNVAVAIASGTTAVTQATGTNLHAVLDTTSTTAVTQATGTNLHAVLDTTSTTAVTQATAASLNATVVNAAGTAAIGFVDPSNTTPQGTTGFKCVSSAAASVLMKDLTGAGQQLYLTAASVTADAGVQQFTLGNCGDAGASTVLWRGQVNMNSPPGWTTTPPGTGQNENLCFFNLSGVQTDACAYWKIAP